MYLKIVLHGPISRQHRLKNRQEKQGTNKIEAARGWPNLLGNVDVSKLKQCLNGECGGRCVKNKYAT